jgi:hypothetical protein
VGIRAAVKSASLGLSPMFFLGKVGVEACTSKW